MFACQPIRVGFLGDARPREGDEPWSVLQARGSDGAGAAAVSVPPMGRANQKPRKGKKHQHLPKVGTATEDARLQHAERQAVGRNMGMGGLSGWMRTVLVAIGVLIVIGAIYSLLVLTVL